MVIPVIQCIVNIYVAVDFAKVGGEMLTYVIGFLSALILISVLAGTSYYLAYRFYCGLTVFFPCVKLWPVLVVVCTLTLIMVVGFGRALLPLPKGVKHVLGLLSGYSMGFVVYLLMFTVAADLILLVFWAMKASFISNHLLNGIVMSCVLLLTVCTCIYGFINAHAVNHVSYEIQLQDKKDISDLNVVMISDLHLGAIGSEDRLEKIIEEINSKQPDVVCIAGDFFDTDFTSIRDPEAALEKLRRINATYGVYACLGNHDGGHTLSQMTEFLEQADIHLLNDKYTVIDDRMILVGRLDSAAIGGYGDKKRKSLSEFFTREDDSLPVIVLDHNPANIDEYTSEADLILCGHTHRGQIFPGNLITKLMYTVDYGYYRKDSQSPQVVVSSGVGVWGMPMRVGTNCEIVTVNFSRSE